MFFGGAPPRMKPQSLGHHDPEYIFAKTAFSLSRDRMPRRLPRGPKGPRLASKGLPGTPKGTQGIPRSPKRSPRSPKTSPRESKGIPRSTNGAPNGIPRGSEEPSGAPKGFVGAPRAPNVFRGDPNGTWETNYLGSQGAPEGLHPQRSPQGCPRDP